MSTCSLAIVREKVEGTIQRLLLTPTRGSEIILGKLFYGVIVAIGEVSLLLILGVGVYKIKVAGDILLVFSLGLLIGLGGIGMGLASSAVSKNELEALLWQSAYIVPATARVRVNVPHRGDVAVPPRASESRANDACDKGIEGRHG